MKRRVGAVLVFVVIAVALLRWRCHRANDSGLAPATSAAKPTDAWRASSASARARPDPKSPATGSLAGTITDAATHAPIAGAEVCADGWSSELPTELLEEPFCVQSDASGRYRIAGLLAATYVVHASARSYLPAQYRRGAIRSDLLVVLAAAEPRAGIDIALFPGAVELTGTVADISGGPIARARVHAGGGKLSFRPRATTETDERGRFSLWVRPGPLSVSASADGYAPQVATGRAPGAVELQLIPEASLAGTVVDAATGQPIAGARVTLTDNERFADFTTALTGSDGTYLIGGLSPGRYSAEARSEHRYGRTEGSLLVGIGQRVDGANIKASPALHIEGKLVVAGSGQPCPDGDVVLRDGAHQINMRLREMPGGIHLGDGALPATYAVTATCEGFASRSYPPIAITDKDVTGVVWEVDPGATVRGKVTTHAGEPVDGAGVSARPAGSERFGDGQFGWSAPDGSYELRGLRPGSYRMEVTTARAPAPEAGFSIEVGAGAVIERNLVLDDGGTLQGTVVDAQGAPVAGMYIQTRAASERFPRSSRNECKSDGTGAFACAALTPGDYRVSASGSRFPRPTMPGSDDGSQPVTVRANEVATVKLVVEARSGSIKGTVLDSAGKPLQDAFVSAARELDGPRGNLAVMETRWSWDARPILTAADGSFTVPGLAAGKYTVRAYRRGGGETIAQHAETGQTVTLQIAVPGTIEGTARRGGTAPTTLSVSVNNPETGLAREEEFFQTGGHYTVRDLPRGHLGVTIEGDGARKTIEVDLGDGEHKTLDAELEALVTITGRVVEKGTTTPVRGVRMLINARSAMAKVRIEDDSGVSDEAGRFTLRNVSAGKVILLGMPPRGGSGGNGGMAFVHAERTIDGTGTVDIGDVELERRAK
ncbi:MAG TPA: carboxypeptidase-like regulatory domain-containing protein [Kofleriaceae bacterium]|nr:carboxypeptidase-like regulatory domain-containing protein [Kofleriaceae bacterium]